MSRDIIRKVRIPSPLKDHRPLILTLRPGDTDEDYFENYTADQTEWAASYECECLQGDVGTWEEERRTRRCSRPWRNVR